MGNSISQQAVFEKCLHMLDIADYRHPYADTGAKKLLTGNMILLMVEAQLHQRDGLWQISENLRAREDWQELLDLDPVHASSLYRKLETLPREVLQELCLAILQRIEACHQEKDGIPDLGKLHIVDASTITLPKIAGEWAYCSKTENSIKIHLRYVVADEKTGYPGDFVLSTGAVSDQAGALDLVIDPDATYVFDRGYLNYSLYSNWVTRKSKFAARVKANSKLKVIQEREVAEEASIVRDADVELVDPETKEAYTLRLVEYKDDEGKVYRVVTNRWDISAFEVSEIYRYRWKIELFFKWMKQHLKVVNLHNHKPEAVWNQIYLAMIAYGLSELIRIETQTGKSNWDIVKLLRIYWHDTWERFLSALHRKPSRTSKGRQKKAKRGRPRKHPKKLKAVQFILK